MDEAKAPALLFVPTDIDPAHEAEVNRWYDTRHVPQRQALPGFLSAKRYVAASGGPKYAAVYDLESPDALKTDQYRALSQPPIVSDEDRQMLTHFQNNMRGVMVQVKQAVPTNAPALSEAGALLAVGLEPEPGYEEEYNAWYDDEHIPYLITVPGVLRVRRFRAVDGLPAYLTLWDLTDPSVRESEAFKQGAETPWTFRMRAHCNRRITAIYRPLVPVAAAARTATA